MQRDLNARIRNNPKFAELVRKRKKYGWQLSILMFVVYYAFILIVAFAPEVLGIPIADGSVITIGIPIGVLIILFAFALTGLYVWRANAEYDELTRQILEDIK
ncbi:MAG TPA: DUF485 domain-containing protein [Arenibaculum sp.]|nr:DUF485 domain-containing protein [Arenibaculum sp.]